MVRKCVVEKWKWKKILKTCAVWYCVEIGNDLLALRSTLMKLHNIPSEVSDFARQNNLTRDVMIAVLKWSMRCRAYFIVDYGEKSPCKSYSTPNYQKVGRNPDVQKNFFHKAKVRAFPTPSWSIKSMNK